jgi:hypothetical protein
LSRWKWQAGPGKIGRPAHSQAEIEQAKPKVLAVIHTLGYRAGKGTLELKLPEMPRRVISATLRAIKTEHRAKEARRWAENRVHIEVRAVWALSCQDSTHIGNHRGRKVWAEVNRDAASTWAEANGDGWPFDADAMLEHLEYLRMEGALPLVLATDNGGAYREARVQQRLQNWQVIHLLSRPRMPWDNSRAEYGIGEGKARAGLGKGVRLEIRAEGVRELAESLQTLNDNWPRQTRGGLTPSQLLRELPHWEKFTRRDIFYRTACEAISAACAIPGCNQRLATREAIFRTLEQFGLILRSRGERKGP